MFQRGSRHCTSSGRRGHGSDEKTRLEMCLHVCPIYLPSLPLNSRSRTILSCFLSTFFVLNVTVYFVWLLQSKGKTIVLNIDFFKGKVGKKRFWNAPVFQFIKTNFIIFYLFL